MTDRFPFNLLHLTRRFFGHVTAKPLQPQEQHEVRVMLGDDKLASLFFAQGSADQRHALHVARRFQELRPEDEQGARAALLHDVGKRRVETGAFGRSLATVLEGLRMPMPDTWRSYRNHGALGAEDLEEAGADALSVAFARHHPGPAPSGFDDAVWAALLQADDL